MSNPTTDRSRQPGGQSNGGQFATEAKSADTGVDLSQDAQAHEEREEIRRYNASGSYFYPRAPKSPKQVIDFWEGVSVPDSVLTKLVSQYKERNKREITEMGDRIYNEEIVPQWNEMAKKLSRKELKELDRKMKERDEKGLTQQSRSRLEAHSQAAKEYFRRTGRPLSIEGPDVQTAVRAFGIARVSTAYPTGSEEEQALLTHKFYVHNVGEERQVDEIVELFDLLDFHDTLTTDTSLDEQAERERQHREALETQKANHEEQARLVAELIDQIVQQREERR